VSNIRVLACRVGQQPSPEVLEDSLQGIQKFVGGFFEAVSIGNNYIIACNEDGISLGLKPNACGILGDFFFCKVEDEDFTSLDDQDVAACVRYNAYKDVPHPSTQVELVSFSSVADLDKYLKRVKEAREEQFRKSQGQGGGL
jgi:hypothetical protein